MKDREKLAKEFTLNAQGLIQNPGKFENQPLFVPYFWELSIEGWHDVEKIHEGVHHFTFYPDFVDVVDNGFVELRNVKSVTVWEGENGFVHYLSEEIK